MKKIRARAMRYEYLFEKDNKFNHKELYDVFELCVSCKACASECPSNVDVAALKSVFIIPKGQWFSLRNKILLIT
jgi:Fe-S oxidoreductase